ncbi:MAG: hypothetical protein LAP85_19745 [Acidobacteriia bacterium]|nr:hypothetical protein [Terriglobia bacterium]
MDKRILELAIETLAKKKADIDAEIASLQAQFIGGIKLETATTASVKGRRHRTPAERKRHSKVMKRVWAARKAKAAKLTSARKTAKEKRKYGPQSAAARAAISKRMRAYWKKRKAAAAKAGK